MGRRGVIAAVVLLALAGCGDAGGARLEAGAASTTAPTSSNTTATTSPGTTATEATPTTAASAEPVEPAPPTTMPTTAARRTSLAGTDWIVVSLVTDGHDVELGELEPTFRITADERSYRMHACNATGGDATVETTTLRLAPGAGTAAGCPEPGRDIDDAMPRLVGPVVSWSATTDRLHLEAPGLVAELVAAPAAAPTQLDRVVLSGEHWQLGYRGDAVVFEQRGGPGEHWGGAAFMIPGEPFDGALAAVPEGRLLFAVLPAGSARATYTSAGGVLPPPEQPLDVHPAPHGHLLAAQVLDVDDLTVVAYDADGDRLGERRFTSA